MGVVGLPRQAACEGAIARRPSQLLSFPLDLLAALLKQDPGLAAGLQTHLSPVKVLQFWRLSAFVTPTTRRGLFVASGSTEQHRPIRSASPPQFGVEGHDTLVGQQSRRTTATTQPGQRAAAPILDMVSDSNDPDT